MEAMKIEFNGLLTARPFADVTDILDGCTIVGVKWVYKWKRDSYGVVDQAKTDMVPMGYGQVEGVD